MRTSAPTLRLWGRRARTMTVRPSQTVSQPDGAHYKTHANRLFNKFVVRGKTVLVHVHLCGGPIPSHHSQLFWFIEIFTGSTRTKESQMGVAETRFITDITRKLPSVSLPLEPGQLHQLRAEGKLMAASHQASLVHMALQRMDHPHTSTSKY